MSNRKQVQDYIVDSIDQILPGSPNKQLYLDKFKKMSNTQFDTFMSQLADGSRHLTLMREPLSKPDLSLQRNLKVAKKLGLTLFQRLWIGPTKDAPRYLTPVKYLVLLLPIRRTAQLVIKKLSVAHDNRTINPATGQVTGKSSAARLSFTEIQVLSGIGLPNTVTELIKYRGGDTGGYTALTSMISKYGTSNQKVLQDYSTGVNSTRTLRIYLQGCHLNNNL